MSPYFTFLQPEPSEIKKIAAEGILTCLQDAIDALKQGLVQLFGLLFNFHHPVFSLAMTLCNLFGRKQCWSFSPVHLVTLGNN